MLKSRFSFIVITETWLKKENDIGFEIPGYKSQAVYRDNTIGGGVKIYYQDHIKVTLLEDYMGDLSSFEGIFLKATVPGYGKINVISVYRPPSRSINDFLLKLNNILELCNGSPTLLAGDFNIDVKNYSSAHNENLTVLMTSHGFKNDINLPTYVSPISKSDTSCIDHVWENLNCNQRSYVIGPNISDHYFVASIYSRIIDDPPVTFKFRDFGLRNINVFESNIDNEFSTFLPPVGSVNDFANCLRIFFYETTQ